jgi:O-antigen/teichoic acid export membrane protein
MSRAASRRRRCGEAGVRVSFVDAVGRISEGRLRTLLAQPAETIDSILTGHDDRSVSQRIALIAFATRVVSAAIAYLSQVIMARWMAEFQYGIFVVVWVGSVIMGGLACLGVQIAVLRFVPEYAERQEFDLLRGVIFGSRVQGLVTSTFFALVGLAGLYTFGDHIAGHYLVPLYLGAVTLPMLALGEIQEGLARSFNWANLALWPTYIVRPLLILLFMGGALWSGAPANAVTAMAAVVAATYVTAVGQFFRLEREMGKAVPRGPRHYLPLMWITVALPIFVVEGFFNLLTNIDILIVGRLMAPEQVAIYFAAVKTMALVHFVYFSVRAGSAQRFSQYYTAGDGARLSAFVRDTLHWTFWPSLAMVAVLALAGRGLLSLFGPSFVEGYPVLFILSAGLLLRASIGPAETLLIMAGQQGITAIVYAATFFLNVSLNFLLIPYLGINGAATATAIALSAETLVLWVVVLGRLSINCSILAVRKSPPGAVGAR